MGWILRDVQQRKLRCAEQPEVVVRGVHRQLVLDVQHGTQRGEARDAAVHHGEPAQPKSNHADGVD